MTGRGLDSMRGLKFAVSGGWQALRSSIEPPLAQAEAASIGELGLGAGSGAGGR